MTINELAQEALSIQDACNLSGVVHSYSRAMSALWDIANKEGKGTDWVNHHPIAVMFASKCASLTGSENSDVFSPSYAHCKIWAKEAR